VADIAQPIMKLRESDQVELKSSWQENHLKAICAFAKGGKFILGVAYSSSFSTHLNL